MAKQALLALTSTAGQLNVTGNTLKAPSFYAYSNNLIAISWFVKDFTGRIYVEGSLASTPLLSDWFPISINNSLYTQYPKDPLHPSGDLGGDTTTDYYQVSSNVLWIRIRLDRSYLVNPNPSLLGSIQKALINY